MSNRRFSFEPTITLGHVLQAVVLLAGALIFVVRMEGELAVQAERVKANTIRIEATEAHMASALGDIRSDIREIRNHVVSSERNGL